MITRLNEILKNDFVRAPYKEEDYIFIESLLDIVLSNKIITRISNYKSTMNIDECINHAIRFMNSIDSRYGDSAKKIIFSNDFDIIYRDDKLSKLYNCNGKKKIELYLKNTIEDSYTITHECFHYINLDLVRQTENWSLITETISITAEGLQKEYFKKLNLPDYKKNDRNTFYSIGIKAYQLDFEIKMLKYYLKYKKIDSEFINSFLNIKNKRYVEAIIDDIEEILEYDELRFYNHQRYIIAAIISSLLINRINSNPSYIKMLIELNDYCNQWSFIDSLEYLGLNIVDKDIVILSDDSLGLLKEEYQKRLAKL